MTAGPSVTSVFAHRGATRGCIENTVAAFVEAGRLGADGVELDVRRTADGALVVHHDAEVPGVGPVSGARVRELPTYVPLLADALDACEGMVVNVEIKSDGDEVLPRATAAAVAELGWADRVVVSSFDAACIETVRNADPRLPVGWLLEWTADAPACLRQAVQRGYQAIHPFVTQVDAPLVAEAHAAGLAVRVWTVNSPGDLRAMVGLGVEAVVTDRLEEALAIAHAGRRADRNGGEATG
jgi:glycerophosphoryl diester phosphodiesterase